MSLQLIPTSGIANGAVTNPKLAMPITGNGSVPTGGTANQVLAKNSATNYDVGWVNQSGGSGGGLTLPLGQNLTFSPNNTYDIGDNASTYRPRDVYVGRNLVVGAGASINPSVAAGSNYLGVGANAGTWAGIYLAAGLNGGGPYYGIYSTPYVASDAGSGAYGYWGNLRTQTATYTITTGAVFYAAVPSLGTGTTVTGMYGLYVANMGATGVTNAYGVYIAAQSGASTTNIGLYNAGSEQIQGTLTANGNIVQPTTQTAQFGRTGIGTASNITDGAYDLRVNAALFVGGSITLGGGSINGVGSMSLGGSLTAQYVVVTTNSGLSTNSNSQNLYLGTNNGGIWMISASTGALLANTDNAYDIGASGANRPRNFYLAGNATISGIAGFGVAPNTSIALFINGAQVTAGATQYGLYAAASFSSAATSAMYAIQAAVLSQSAPFSTATAAAIFIQSPTLGGGNTVSNFYGLLVANQGNSSISQAYGIYIQNQSGATGLNIGLYNVATTYLGGTVGIGNNPAVYAALLIQAANLTGSTEYGIYANPSFAPSATTAATIFYAKYSAQSGTYTTPTGIGLNVATASLSAGVTVTNMYGVYINNQGVSGATNAYGIYVANPTGAATDNGSIIQGDVGLGLTASAQLATSSTTGFVWIPSMAGAPTANPARASNPTGVGRVALVYDSTDNRIYINIGGTTWHYWNMTA